MALHELVKVEKPPVATRPENPNEEWYGRMNELLTLGDDLNNGITELNFRFHNKIVTIKGIPEDYRILLDDKKVCECVYDNVYNADMGLVKELLG